FAPARQYGSKATPRVSNLLALPREGHTLLRVGRNLYVAGGTTVASDTSAAVAGTDSVERSFVLDYDQMPLMHTPTEIGANGLPAGVWYYRVSALGAWGEGLGSAEVTARTGGGAVQVCWKAPAGATKFNVFRSLASDGRGSTEALIAAEVAGPCFMDDGAGD